MNIYKFAMQMEKDGENYYRELADNCHVEGIKTILIMLADEEAKHFNTIAQLQKHADNSSPARMSILDNVKNIFTRMKEAKADLRFDSSDLDAYQSVLDIEEKSRKFYIDQAGNAEDEVEKKTFLQLAGEEEKHCRIMENIVEFVGRPEPGNWLENAEWHHLDEY